MSTGKVKFFNQQGGWGFIIDSSSKKEIFVHINNVKDKDILKQDDEVTFEIADGKKGKMAVNVELSN